MHLTHFSKTLLSQTLIIAGLSTGMGLNVAYAAEASAPSEVSEASAPSVENLQSPDAVNDQELNRRVTAQLSLQPSLKTSSIRVTSKNGRVTLHGTVRSQYARHMAVSTAKATAGVSAVVNKLYIRSTHHGLQSGH